MKSSHERFNTSFAHDFSPDSQGGTRIMKGDCQWLIRRRGGARFTTKGNRRVRSPTVTKVRCHLLTTFGSRRTTQGFQYEYCMRHEPTWICSSFLNPTAFRSTAPYDSELTPYGYTIVLYNFWYLPFEVQMGPFVTYEDQILLFTMGVTDCRSRKLVAFRPSQPP